jgi:hypothetical protein
VTVSNKTHTNYSRRLEGSFHTTLANFRPLKTQVSKITNTLVELVYIPSSRMTLSPNTMTSNSPFDCKRVRIFWLGLLRALTSRAQTPILPTVGSFAAHFQLATVIQRKVASKRFLRSASLVELAAVLPLNLLGVRLEDLADRFTSCPAHPSEGPVSLRELVEEPEEGCGV